MEKYSWRKAATCLTSNFRVITYGWTMYIKGTESRDSKFAAGNRYKYLQYFTFCFFFSFNNFSPWTVQAQACSVAI